MAHQPGKAVDGKAPAGGAPGQEERSGEPAVGVDDIFALRRPKDAQAGLSSGLISIAPGIAGGVAGLVAAPIVGATRDGVAGFAKGLASGERPLTSNRALSRSSCQVSLPAAGCHGTLVCVPHGFSVCAAMSLRHPHGLG